MHPRYRTIASCGKEAEKTITITLWAATSNFITQRAFAL